MAAKFELPSTLTNALAGFVFTGKTLWTLSEGRRNVKLEITLLLQDPRKRPTNQRARAVQDTAATPTVQPEQPRETPPPSTSQMTAEPATVNYRRPVSSAAIPPSPALQQPTPQPIVRRKIMRSSTPLPSTQHQPMEVTTPDLHRCVSEPPEPRQPPRHTEQLPKWNSFVAYTFDIVYEHHQRLDFVILKGYSKKRKCAGDPPVFFVNMLDKRQPWYMFKGPQCKRYHPEWWDYLESYKSTATPLPQKQKQEWGLEFVNSVSGHKRKRQKLLRPAART